MKKITLFLYLFIFTSGSLLGINPPQIPKSSKGYGFAAYDKPNEVETAAALFASIGDWDILEPHGYEFGFESGFNDLSRLMKILTVGYGFLIIAGHGSSDGWIAIEYWGTDEAAAIERMKKLQGYYNAGLDEIRYVKNKQTGICDIRISPLFLQKRTNLPYSLVFVDACHSKFFINAFNGAGCCFGWEGVVGEVQGDDAFTSGPQNIFYRTGGKDLSGVVDQQGDLRNKTVGKAREEYGDARLMMSGNPEMKLYNSTRIAGVLIKQGENIIYQYGVYGDNPQSYPYEWDYGGSTESGIKSPASIGDKAINVKILFSSFMDEDMLDEVRVKSEEGSEEYIVSVGNTGVRSCFLNFQI